MGSGDVHGDRNLSAGLETAPLDPLQDDV